MIYILCLGWALLMISILFLYKQDRDWVRKYNLLAREHNLNVKEYQALSKEYLEFAKKHDTLIHQVSDKQIYLGNFKKDNTLN